MIQLNSKHYKIFLACLENQLDNQKPIGRIPRNWYRSVIGEVNTRLIDKQLCRNTLRDFCADDKNSHAECVASVMSWGGQRVGHGQMLFGAKIDRYKPIDAVVPIVASMRAGRACRISAYEQFHQLRIHKKLKGMGIAYFTKLIYFCCPKPDGYILDQWLAKSVNLLSGHQLIQITKSGYVSDENDCHKYSEFCKIVDYIAIDTGKTSDQIETAMFSNGGHDRNKGDWRRHLISPI